MRLLRLAGFGGLAIAGMLIIILFGYIFIDSSISRYQAQIEQAKTSLKAQKLDETQAKVEELSSDLKLIVQVLNKEVMFSKLIKQIGAVMPPKSVLRDIEISKVQGGIDLTANAQDYVTATQVQVNLQDPANKVFEKADIVSIDCSSSLNPKYPCTITLRALFAKNNPYLFINQGKSKP
jgi:Tfp pilus assembly protein PilN